MAYTPEKPEPNAFLRALGATPEHGVDGHRVVGLVVAVVALLLILQNSSSSELHFLIFSFRAPIWIITGITLVLGALGWELLKRGQRRRRVEAAKAAPPPPPPPPPPQP